MGDQENTGPSTSEQSNEILPPGGSTVTININTGERLIKPFAHNQRVEAEAYAADVRQNGVAWRNEGSPDVVNYPVHRIFDATVSGGIAE